MSRQSKELAEYLHAAVEDLTFIRDMARERTLTADQLIETAKTCTNAAAKCRRALVDLGPEAE